MARRPKWAVRSKHGEWYRGMVQIGPSFSRNRSEAVLFELKRDAESAAASLLRWFIAADAIKVR